MSSSPSHPRRLRLSLPASAFRELRSRSQVQGFRRRRELAVLFPLTVSQPQQRAGAIRRSSPLYLQVQRRVRLRSRSTAMLPATKTFFSPYPALLLHPSRPAVVLLIPKS